MGKIELDKYYTSKELAKYCVNKTKEIVGSENITEYIEPSAGNGVFLNYLDKSYKAYDIEPEDIHNRIIRQDYIKLELSYKEGRCIIGNPPYGTKNKLYLQFYKKSIQLGDYISFILPISQYNNSYDMYDFDLIYSEDLGKRLYSEKEVHCSFNIYKRNSNGLNKRTNYNLKDIVLKGVSRGKARNDKVPENYDFSLCGFGASMGKFCDYESQYCQQIYITINNEKYKEQIIDLIKNVNWRSLYNMTTVPKLKHWMVYKYIKEQIPEIK